MVEAIVEFDYQAQHDDELTISVGEVITNIRKEDGGWWEGQINGRRGLFPDNFVREIKKDMKKDLLSNKAPEKPMHDVSSGNALLSSETILRTNKRDNWEEVTSSYINSRPIEDGDGQQDKDQGLLQSNISI